MITHIRMKNFKSWKDSGEVQLAPLTGFFGTNSSGKSSLLQMLLLLKQTSSRTSSAEAINLGNERSQVYIRSFRDVINTPELPVEFGFSCKLQQPLPVYTSLNEEPPIMLMMDSFTFDTTLREYMGKPSVDNFRYRMNQDGILELVWERRELAFGNQIDGDGFETVPLKNINNCYGVPLSLRGKPHRFLHQFSSAFDEVFSDVYFYGINHNIHTPNFRRTGQLPKDSIHWVNYDIKNIILANLREQELNCEERQSQIEVQISKWLQEMGFICDILIKVNGFQHHRNIEIHVKNSRNGIKLIPNHVGCGLTELLPLLLLCYSIPNGSTFILEHPGSLLHPMVQSQLADLLIEVVNDRKLQILVESHSEHLLNRLQRRIAEEQINVDQTALYFCRNEKGVSDIERLNVDEFGNISNWPANFFGNEVGDLFAMNDAQRKRRKSEEG